MKFSLVVTCYNEIRGLARWRQEIEAQTRPPDEIIIVDSESKDGTTKFLQGWASIDPRVKVIVQKCKPARGHNIGNEAAAYEHIVSTDMGVRIDPRWFEEIVKPFEQDPSIDVVAGNYCIDKGSLKTAVARAEYYIENGGFAQFGLNFVVGNRSVAYTKRVWREVGGLPEDLTQYADDSVFGRQILEGGYNVAFAPKAMVYWCRPPRLKQYWKECFNYGRGGGEAFIKTPFAFSLYRQGKLPAVLVPLLTGLRRVQTHFKWRAVNAALRNRDIVAVFYMPILLFGNGWSQAKGYLVGYTHGNTHCLNCRARLRLEV